MVSAFVDWNILDILTLKVLMSAKEIDRKTIASAVEAVGIWKILCVNVSLEPKHTIKILSFSVYSAQIVGLKFQRSNTCVRLE